VNPAKQYEMYEADSVFQSSFQKDNIFFIDSLSKKLNETKNKFNEKISQFDDIITAASIKYDIPKSLIKAIIIAESAGNPAAISKSGAKGLMQLMDATALDLGVKDSFDPEENIFGGTLYIKQMLHRFNDNLDFALAAYNAGPGNVDKFNGIPPFNETQSYIVKVKRYNEMFQASNF
jgi:soluble lytic murein transglycosylase-like protein